MQIVLISRQFSKTFSYINKSTNFQNAFQEINKIFPKSKRNMSESKNQPKSTSNVKTTEDEMQRRGPSNTRPQNGEYAGAGLAVAAQGQGSQIAEYYNSNTNMNPNNFHMNYPWGYHQTGLGYNSQPSFVPLTPMNGTFYYQTFGSQYYNSELPFCGPNQLSKQSNTSVDEKQMRERIMRFRQMIKCRSCDDSQPNEFRFSIMTYNILSQNLLEEHSSLYEHCQESALNWPQRGQTIIKELLESDSDILCLQEVHSKHFEDLLMPALKQKGYNFVFKQRTGGKMDGCAIVYRESKFSLLNSVKLDYMRKDLSSILDRDNIALIVELKPKDWSRDSKLVVANTHLLYNPKRGDIKLAQIRLLMAEIHKMAQISGNNGVFEYNPIILCGDFNSEPNSLIYKFITKGLVNFDGCKVGDISGQRKGYGIGRDVEDHHLKLLGVTSDTRFEHSSEKPTEVDVQTKMSIKHNFNLKSVVYKFDNKYGNKLISSSNRFDSVFVDYIFYDCEKLKLHAFQKLMTESQLPQIGYIPNSVLGSDHLSFKAIFSII